jgi:uncharacterized membrane protein YidH (DUF202 family)
VGTDYSEFEREWIELLNEVRVLLPGVQLLFAFLWALPFFGTFGQSGVLVHRVFLGSFLCATGASAFLIAPSVYHRFHWRRDVRDKEEMLRTCNRLAIVGVVLLAVAMTSAVFLVSLLVFGAGPALITTLFAALMFSVLWFVLPLSRRARDQSRS